MSIERPLSAKVRSADNVRRKGAPIPARAAHAPPLVVWHRRGCRHRLLRVFLRPDGWQVMTAGFRVPLDEGVRRRNELPGEVEEGLPALTKEAVRSGEYIAPAIRKVAGRDVLMPHDLTGAAWQGWFEVGCRDKRTRHELAELAADVAKARATHRAVKRDID